MLSATLCFNVITVRLAYTENFFVVFSAEFMLVSSSAEGYFCCFFIYANCVILEFVFEYEKKHDGISMYTVYLCSTYFDAYNL